MLLQSCQSVFLLMSNADGLALCLFIEVFSNLSSIVSLLWRSLYSNSYRRFSILFLQFPPASEEYESLTSDDSAAIAFTSDLLDDLNLDRSTPDTYRSPPAPIPFEVVLGHSQSIGSQFTDETVVQHSCDIKLSDRKAEMESLLASLKKTGIDLVKSNPPIIKSAEEEDVCPTCLEGIQMNIIRGTTSVLPPPLYLFLLYFLYNQPFCEWLKSECLYFAEYDTDNPRIVSKCNHHFHLSCILEWMERSRTCPICDQV